MPLFSRKKNSKSRNNNNNNSSPTRLPVESVPESMDAAGLSRALLVELRGQRQDFQQTYALLESRLDKLEKAISHQPRAAGSATQPAVGSPSDEETRYVLGDAESMEIIVNLGPLRTGRPLSVEKRAPTPSSRRWWDQDHGESEDGAKHGGECMRPVQDPRRGRVMDPDSKHAAFHAGKFAAESSSPSQVEGGGGKWHRANAPSSYHWIIGPDGAVREAVHEKQPPTPTPQMRSRMMLRQAPSQQPPPGRGTTTLGPGPSVMSIHLKPRVKQAVSQDCVVLLAPDEQRKRPGDASTGTLLQTVSSVCFSFEDADDEDKERGKKDRAVKLKHDDSKRKDDIEAKKREQEAKRSEKMDKKSEQEADRREKMDKKSEQEAKKSVQEVRKSDQEAKKREQDAKKREQEVKKQEQEAKKCEQEAKKREQEAKKREKEEKKSEQDAKKREQEAKKREQEAKKREQEAKKWGQEAKRREKTKSLEQEAGEREQETKGVGHVPDSTKAEPILRYGSTQRTATAAAGTRENRRERRGLVDQKIGQREREEERQRDVGERRERAEHIGPRADSPRQIDTLTVPWPILPKSSICFSLEEADDIIKTPTAREGQGLGQGQRSLLKPPAQHRARGPHGPHGPHGTYTQGPRGGPRGSSAARLSWLSRSAPPPGRSGRSPSHPTPNPPDVDADNDLRSCLRCVEYRPLPPPQIPVRLRISPTYVSRLGPRIKAWDADTSPRRRRSRRGLHEDDLEPDGLPLRERSSCSTRRVSEEEETLAKSNIRLAKIYAKTDLAKAAASAAPPPPRRPVHYRPLQHLPTCPQYEGRSLPDDDKRVETLFESKAAERAARRAAAWSARAHKDYLAHLSEYVRSISKGPGVGAATVIRNQLREPSPLRDGGSRGGSAPSARSGKGRELPDVRGPLPPRMTVRNATPRAKHKGDIPRPARRKQPCRDCRSARHRGGWRVGVRGPDIADRDTAAPSPHRQHPDDLQDDPSTRRGSQEHPTTQPNNTICSFICDYCRKLRLML